MSRPEPLVSIIMGAYNCADCIGNSIESMLHQTYQNWEFIICDDCSTDDTVNVIEKYAEKDSRIHLIRNTCNRKLPYTLNHCLQYVQGDYVARMDADDIALSNRLKLQVDYLEHHPEYAVVGGGIIPFDENGARNKYLPTEIPDKRTLIRRSPFLHPTIMIRTPVLCELNGYTVKTRTIKGQDLDLWYRLYARGYQGYNLQIPVLKYRASLQDYKKKRNLKAAWGITQTKFIGFYLNRFPLYLYPFALKPIVSALIPKQIMFIYHNHFKR